MRAPAPFPILWALILSLAIGGAAWATAATPGALRDAKASAARAARRAEALDARAAASDDPAARARLAQAAVAARVRGAEAEIDAAAVRSRLVGDLLARQRSRLAEQQGPVARVLAALVSLARRPALASLAQPGSVADLVHVQAVLGTVMPAVAARTTTLRRDLARTRALQASASVARASLETGRGRLLEAREQLAALDEAGDGETAQALGERTRDIVDQLRTVTDAQAVLDDLVALPAPPRPAPRDPGAGSYRLPVFGRLVTGTGEVSDSGVRARGLTFAVPAAVPVIAPAAGRVVFAGPFRSFGGVVIIDHGAGWTTLVSGLGAVAIGRGATIGAGVPIGRARADPQARVTVELRRAGRPIDLAAMIG